jgi:hypothetical protein
MAVAVVALLVAIPGLLAQDRKPTAYDVKAAYLYSFGRFVEWPARGDKASSSSFSVCVLGQDPFGSTLDATLAHQRIAGKDVVAKRIAAAEDAVDCQILFISSSEKSRLEKILAVLDKFPVLTVGDLPQFSERGGMIQFLLDSNRVRFEVNLRAVQNAGLNPSSELLKVAMAIRKDAPLRD